ncbi:MAG: DUF7901 domain-containing protein [Phycisphaerae bacterium]
MSRERELTTVACILVTLLFATTRSAIGDTVKWSQPPKPDNPRVWCYSTEPLGGIPPRPSADDFQCNSPEPIVDVHWWGVQAIAGDIFRIRFYKDVPDPDPNDPSNWSHPGEVLYQADVNNWTQTWDPSVNAWYFSVDLPTPFQQEPGTIYWFSTAYVGQQGWHWLQADQQPPWNDVAVNWVPENNRWEDPDDKVDLAFELTVGGPLFKWEQPPEAAQPTDVFYGWNEKSDWWYGPVVADDWVCTTPDPVTDIHWWGSFLGWRYPYPPGLPNHFHIQFWTDVPPMPPDNFSHPGQVIHEVYCYNYTCEFAGWDYDPRTRQYEACFKFTQALQPEEYFYQDEGPNGRNVYWISIAACDDGEPSENPFGWKTRPRSADSPAPDDAVVIEFPRQPVLGSQFESGHPLAWPTPEDSWDMAFELTTQSTETKYMQVPELEPTGMDVNATADPFGTAGYILADDFPCTRTGPVTQIVVYGSWRQDQLPGGDPHNVSFTLSIHSDIPAGPVPFSMPGGVLWWRDFEPGAFSVERYAGNLSEGWLDPPYMYDPQGDTVCYRYVFNLGPGEFFQQGTPDQPTVYWLDVQARPMTAEALFGWKTSPIHWNDDAVWGTGSEPYYEPWEELRYPPMHPFFPQSIDLAFEIQTQGVKWSQPPQRYNPPDAYNGWNELSWYGQGQIVADDWLCTTEQPVTDIHWWGSFIGWDKLEPPPVMPTAFHIAIWTDVQPNGTWFSHPGRVLWETYCSEFTWEFVGWDWDPRFPAEAGSQQPNWNPPEACFKFQQQLAWDQWFWQEPGENIYWVSIAAIYPDGAVVDHPWGWKTRPRDPESPAPDGAVVIYDPSAPTLDSVFVAGWPIAWDGELWDMAFSLSTIEEQPTEYEYGDAPEGTLAYPASGVNGNFPTCRTVPLAPWIQHTNFGAWLGPQFDFEPDGNAGLCPVFNPYDADECFQDGDAGLMFPPAYTINAAGNVVLCPMAQGAGSLGQPCQNAVWGVNIDVDVHNHMPSQSVGYLNVLIDWDQNGQWGGASPCPLANAPEHVLVNYPIPNPFDGPVSALMPAGTGFLIGPNAGEVWMRVSITERPVPLNWDGAGAFEDGETEDYLLNVEQPKHDLGDAPDSTNSFGVAMTAYPPGGPPGVQAHYPTVFAAGSPPFGPIHLQPHAVAFLGNAVTLENEADTGLDEDPTNNIIPLADAPDKDGADDGLLLPLVFPHCQPAQFNYVVTVTGIVPTPLYVNAWCDWNRDGDWDDVLPCSLGQADEWAVQNQMLSFLEPGIYILTTPPFLPWHPVGAPGERLPLWMRITLSEQPWQASPGIIGYGGCGPAAGYQFGETEDYFVTPEIPEPPKAIAWRSVRNHGPLGPLAIDLDPSATGVSVKSEARRNGIQLIEVDFDQAVVLTNPGGITVTDWPGGGSYIPTSVTMVDADTLAIGFAVGLLPDRNCYRIDLDSCVQSPAGLPLAGDTDCWVRALVGDVNNDGRVSTTDIAFVKSRIGQSPALPGNARFDINTDGNISTTDIALVKSLVGNAAACP